MRQAPFTAVLCRFSVQNKMSLILMRKKKTQWTHDTRLFREIIFFPIPREQKKSIVMNVAPVEAFPFAAVLVPQ